MQYEKNPKTGEDLHFNEEVIKDGLDHKTIKRFAYIKHNKDPYTIEEEKQGKGKAGELKNDHWHVVLECPGKVDIKYIAKWFNVPEQYIELPKGRGAFLDKVAYLTHESEKEQAKGKALYDDDEVIANFDWRKELIEREENKLKYGGDLCPKDRMRYDVRYLGKTLKECQDEDKKMYMDNEKDLTYLRLRYINELKPPKERINIYISGEGGNGKGLMSKAIARSLFPDITNEEDIYFCVGAEGAEFIGYDGQPIIIWSDKRSWELLKVLKGRGNAFEVLDPHPDRKNQNVKYASTNLCNKINIINSVQCCSDFLDRLAGEYTDKQGNKQEAEDKTQSYRRFPLTITINDNSYDLKVNKGYKDNTKDFLNYYEYLNIDCNLQQIRVMCGDNEALAKELEKQAIEPILKEYNEIVNREKPQYTEAELREMFKNVGKVRTQKPEKESIKNKSELGHIYTTDCEYYYTYPCADIEKPEFDYKKCIVPSYLNEYECKQNLKEFEKIHRELEAQKAKEEKEKAEKEKEAQKQQEAQEQKDTDLLEMAQDDFYNEPDNNDFFG